MPHVSILKFFSENVRQGLKETINRIKSTVSETSSGLLLNSSHLTRLKWNLKLVFTCISLTANDVEL
jgi:hypothetical protein